MPDNQPDDVRGEVRDALYEMLIDKVRNDRFPSATMMNMVEDGIDQRHLREYAEVLLDKIDRTQYPSADMLKRLNGLL